MSGVYSVVADVTPLVQEHPRATFVLMHTAWPQQEQLLALAKHQPNVVVDASWSWTLAPRSTAEFVAPVPDHGTGHETALLRR